MARTAVAALVLVVSTLAPASVSAQCLELGTKQYCSTQIPTPWRIGLCDEAGAFTSRRIAWCNVSGGTWNGSDCIGGSEHNEGNMVSRSVGFANIVRSSSCTLSGDTGWHATYTTNLCSGGADETSHGYLLLTSRRLTITCDSGSGETISATKRRGLECPVGWQLVSLPFYGFMCSRPLEDKCCERKGNPITPATGVKTQTETDYRHGLGLEITRHYHSFKFYDARTNVVDAHGESRFGTVWRSSYDKRVIPLQPASQLNASIRHARTLPDGEIQYFDPSGNEVLNYRGAAGTLVVVPGTGFYYKDPGGVEFYGTDGRLRVITGSDGRALTLTYSDGTNGPNGGVVHDGAGYPTAHVLRPNHLIRVVDSFGNTLAFKYDAYGRIVVAAVPGGAEYRYAYGDVNLNLGNLQSILYPDGTAREYRYNEPANMVGGADLPHALTSIIDENGAVFGSYRYDTSGRAVSTERAGGVNRYEITYNTDGTSSIVDPLNTARTFGFATVDGVQRFTGASQPEGATGIKAATYAANGNVTSRTDFNDVKACYAYLVGRNLETARVEGLPAAANCTTVLAAGAALPAGSRKILTEWHPRWRLPVRVSEPGRRTTYSYNGDSTSSGAASCAPIDALIADGSPAGTPIAVLCAKTVEPTTDLTDGAQGFAAPLAGPPRTWTHTYNSVGQVLSVDGPRTDVADTTSYAYDPQGNLVTTTNAAGHVTSVTAYNAHGQPLTIVDANRLTTTLAYDPRQRLVSRTVGSEATGYEYDDAGLLRKATLPDGSFLEYSYDAAHRLTGMQDNLGNRIVYTLDGMGNRTKEEVFDPAQQLAQTRSRVYSSLNRLFRETGAQNQTTEYSYDERGNVLTVKDPLDRISANQYDALNRLRQVTDPALGVTQYAYNGLDALVQVTDPRSLVTGYTVDGLGNLTHQASPDTGTTASTYDAAGNLLTSTDAKSQTTTYAYDALNRATTITFHDGSEQLFAYDQGPNALGRLSGITERSSEGQVTSQIAYAYDHHGRVTSETRTAAGQAYVTAYRYDSAGRLDQMTYPSGRTVNYAFDTVGRVSAISTAASAGSPQTVVQSVAYHAFGGVKSYTLGNGQTYARSYDLDGRIASYTLGAKSFGIGYDAASRIEFIAEITNLANTNAYGYDALDRLTQATTPSNTYGYSYDAVGNRTSRAAGSSFDTYAYSPESNRIASITPLSGPVRSFTFDDNGSTTADGNNAYTYDARGRMLQAVSALGTTSYQVNALGQRVRKTNVQGDRVFHYDMRGRLIAETGTSGAVKREIFYLGDIPVGVFQ